MNAVPLISIVTSTLDCAAALVATAESLRSQRWHACQWIVADGGSTDGTLQVIRDNADVIADWFSERDSGIYDAWNKACPYVRGNWVLFLGAGDVLAASNTLERIASALSTLPSAVDFLYGNVVQTAGDHVLYRYGKVDLESWQLCRPAVPAHQGVLHRAQVLQSPAPFDARYSIAGDTKLMLQYMRPHNTRYLDLDIARMQAGGISSNASGALRVMREVLRLEADLGYRIPRVQRTSYIARTYMKAILSRTVGPGAVDSLIRVKQRIVGPRT